MKKKFLSNLWKAALGAGLAAALAACQGPASAAGATADGAKATVKFTVSAPEMVNTQGLGRAIAAEAAKIRFTLDDSDASTAPLVETFPAQAKVSWNTQSDGNPNISSIFLINKQTPDQWWYDTSFEAEVPYGVYESLKAEILAADDTVLQTQVITKTILIAPNSSQYISIYFEPKAVGSVALDAETEVSVAAAGVTFYEITGIDKDTMYEVTVTTETEVPTAFFIAHGEWDNPFNLTHTIGKTGGRKSATVFHDFWIEGSKGYIGIAQVSGLSVPPSGVDGHKVKVLVKPSSLDTTQYFFQDSDWEVSETPLAEADPILAANPHLTRVEIVVNNVPAALEGRKFAYAGSPVWVADAEGNLLGGNEWFRPNMEFFQFPVIGNVGKKILYMDLNSSSNTSIQNWSGYTQHPYSIMGANFAFFLTWADSWLRLAGSSTDQERSRDSRFFLKLPADTESRSLTMTLDMASGDQKSDLAELRFLRVDGVVADINKQNWSGNYAAIVEKWDVEEEGLLGSLPIDLPFDIAGDEMSTIQFGLSEGARLFAGDRELVLGRAQIDLSDEWEDLKVVAEDGTTAKYIVNVREVPLGVQVEAVDKGKVDITFAYHEPDAGSAYLDVKHISGTYDYWMEKDDQDVFTYTIHDWDVTKPLGYRFYVNGWSELDPNGPTPDAEGFGIIQPADLIGTSVSEAEDGSISITWNYYDPDAESVTLMGEMQAKPWDGAGEVADASKGIAMTKSEDGVWAVTLPAEADTVWKYKFVVDGEWTEDPLAAQRMFDDFNGYNSVVNVPFQMPFEPPRIVGFTLAKVVPNQTYFLVGAYSAIQYEDGSTFMAGSWGSSNAWDPTAADRTFKTDADGGVAKTFSKPVIFGNGGYKWTEGSGWAYEIGPNDNGGGDFNSASAVPPEEGDYRLLFTGSGNVAKNKATVTVVQ